MKGAAQKVLDIEKAQAELEAKRIQEKLDKELIAKEKVKEQGKEVERAKEEEVKVEEPDFEEPITELDTQLGSPEPEALTTEGSPYRDASPTETKQLRRLYEERKDQLFKDPDLYLGKLINDVNRWLDGEDVAIDKVRDELSSLATRSDEARHMFDRGEDFDAWRESASEAASWARGADRLDKPTMTLDSLGGQQLYETFISNGKKFVRLFHATSPHIAKMIKEKGFKELNISDIVDNAIELTNFPVNKKGEIINFLKENYLDPESPIDKGRGIYFSAKKERVTGEDVVLQEGMLNALNAISYIDKGVIGKKAKTLERQIE